MIETREQTARRHYHTNLSALSAKAFEAHAVIERARTQWRICRMPRSFEFAVDVVVTQKAQIAVIGDIDPVVFGYGNGSPLELIGWIGKRPEVTDYVFEKARIGTGDAATHVDDDVALGQVYDFLEDQRKGGGEGIYPTHTKEHEQLIRSTVDAMEGPLGFSAEHFMDAFGWELPEYFPNFGVVPAARVYYAHAAIRRLHLLLQQ